jgi:hypothetical protein
MTTEIKFFAVAFLSGAVAGAQVDLNPQQVDATLFAFNSPQLAIDATMGAVYSRQRDINDIYPPKTRFHLD